MTDEAESETSAPDAAVPPQYGVGPFSLRELLLVCVWAVLFLVSFFSTVVYTFSSVWSQGIGWILPVAVPTVAVFLIVLRRLSPTGIRRVGSLGIDQFASVAFSVAAVVWIGDLWSQIAFVVMGGAWSLSWVVWAEAVLAVTGVVLTVGAGLIPALAADFVARPATLAHRAARPVRPVVARPAPTRVPAATAGAAGVGADGAASPADAVTTADGTPDAGQVSVPREESALAERTPERAASDTVPSDTSAAASETAATAAGPAAASDPAIEAAAPTRAVTTVDDGAGVTVSTPSPAQAFWVLVPEDRDVVDESGVPLFRIGPTAWALVIEDRGTAFVVRHEDGRLGFLRDISGVTRG